MTGDRIPSLIMQIVDELRAHGIVITRRADEWRVNFRGDTDATAYVTDDCKMLSMLSPPPPRLIPALSLRGASE
jgi:hypothetical protein